MEIIVNPDRSIVESVANPILLSLPSSPYPEAIMREVESSKYSLFGSIWNTFWLNGNSECYWDLNHWPRQVQRFSSIVRPNSIYFLALFTHTISDTFWLTNSAICQLTPPPPPVIGFSSEDLSRRESPVDPTAGDFEMDYCKSMYEFMYLHIYMWRKSQKCRHFFGDSLLISMHLGFMVTQNANRHATYLYNAFSLFM